MLASNVLDKDDPNANMYGCQPCPKCRGRFRVAYHHDDGLLISCGDCGFEEAGVEAQTEEEP